VLGPETGLEAGATIMLEHPEPARSTRLAESGRGGHVMEIVYNSR
jgi:hypothetical protein